MLRGFPMAQWKEFTCNAGNVGDPGSIPGSGRCPGGGNGNPLQYSCLEYPMDREVWWATVHGVAKSQARLKRLSRHACICVCMYTYTHSIDIHCLYLTGVGRRFYCGDQQG